VFRWSVENSLFHTFIRAHLCTSSNLNEVVSLLDVITIYSRDKYLNVMQRDHYNQLWYSYRLMNDIVYIQTWYCRTKKLIYLSPSNFHCDIRLTSRKFKSNWKVKNPIVGNFRRNGRQSNDSKNKGWMNSKTPASQVLFLLRLLYNYFMSCTD
jgi:hypothetical protein